MSTTTTTTSSIPSPAKLRRRSASFSSASCNHSPSLTLDLLLLPPILLSTSFLIFSSFSHIFHSLTLILPPLLSRLLSQPIPSSLLSSPILLLFLFLILAVVIAMCIEIGTGEKGRGRRCRNPKCRGLKDAVEFDVQVQTEEGMKAPMDEVWREIAELPWKGGGVGDNPDYECVRKELRRMAPVNGRAVLLFRARCGCPLSKLEGWGPKRGRRHKNGSFSGKCGGIC